VIYSLLFDLIKFCFLYLILVLQHEL
jgi:hypothetical protein